MLAGATTAAGRLTKKNTAKFKPELTFHATDSPGSRRNESVSWLMLGAFTQKQHVHRFKIITVIIVVTGNTGELV